MSKRGRYGKYGEIKRFERLRQSKTSSALASQDELKRQKRSGYKKKVAKKERVPIRAGMPSDSGFIRALSHTVFSQYGPYDDILSEYLELGNVLVLIGSLKGKSVGFVMVDQIPSDTDLGDTWEIVAIAVLPQSQRKGAGTALLQAVMGAASEWGASALTLHTATHNLAAQDFFRKHGFEVLEHRSGFYPEGQDALLMHRNLVSTST